MTRPKHIRELARRARTLWYGALITGGVTGAVVGGLAGDTFYAHRRAARARRTTTPKESSS